MIPPVIPAPLSSRASNQFSALQAPVESDTGKGGTSHEAADDLGSGNTPSFWICNDPTRSPSLASPKTLATTRPSSDPKQRKKVTFGPGTLPVNSETLPNAGAARKALLLRRSAPVKRLKLKMAALRTQRCDKTLCVDSGSTHDMFKEREVFTNCTPLDNTFILAADDSPITVAGKGTVTTRVGDQIIRLHNCLRVPGLAMSLLSVRTHR